MADLGFFLSFATFVVYFFVLVVVFTLFFKKNFSSRWKPEFYVLCAVLFAVLFTEALDLASGYFPTEYTPVLRDLTELAVALLVLFGLEELYRLSGQGFGGKGAS